MIGPMCGYPRPSLPVLLHAERVIKRRLRIATETQHPIRQTLKRRQTYVRKLIVQERAKLARLASLQQPS